MVTWSFRFKTDRQSTAAGVDILQGLIDTTSSTTIVGRSILYHNGSRLYRRVQLVVVKLAYRECL